MSDSECFPFLLLGMSITGVMTIFLRYTHQMRKNRVDMETQTENWFVNEYNIIIEPDNSIDLLVSS
jgi:hypothetical protein